MLGHGSARQLPMELGFRETLDELLHLPDRFDALIGLLHNLGVISRNLMEELVIGRVVEVAEDLLKAAKGFEECVQFHVSSGIAEIVGVIQDLLLGQGHVLVQVDAGRGDGLYVQGVRVGGHVEFDRLEFCSMCGPWVVVSCSKITCNSKENSKGWRKRGRKEEGFASRCAFYLSFLG